MVVVSEQTGMSIREVFRTLPMRTCYAVEHFYYLRNEVAVRASVEKKGALAGDSLDYLLSL